MRTRITSKAICRGISDSTAPEYAGCAVPNAQTPADHGFVLMAVLFVLTFLSLAAMTFSQRLQTHLAITRNTIANAEAEALADAGANLAMLDLVHLGPGEQRRFARDGTPGRCRRPDGGTITVSVRDEAGKVDLNFASEELLTALFAGAGFGRDAARSKAAAIADYRDGDQVRRADGAERGDYSAIGRVGPKNAPFAGINELAGVLGIDRALAERLAPYVTVHAAQDGIDAEAADPDLIALLMRGTSGTTGGAANGLDASSLFSSARVGLPPQFLSVSVGRNFLLTSVGETASGARFARE
ncbi:MAG: hypothetical protein ABL907_00475, partial [Hyphomicrobium sp.]